MDKVIVEELIRGLAFFFLFYILTIVLGSQFFHESTISLYAIIGIPLIFTVIVFSFFVYRRKTTGREYKLRRGSAEYRMMMVIVTISCFFFIISGVRNITDGNSLIGLIWISFGIISGALGITEIGRKTCFQQYAVIRLQIFRHLNALCVWR